MTCAYWGQFTVSELNEILGLVDQEDDQDDYHCERNEIEECRCGNCMDCLGLSWRDFF